LPGKARKQKFRILSHSGFCLRRSKNLLIYRAEKPSPFKAEINRRIEFLRTYCFLLFTLSKPPMRVKVIVNSEELKSKNPSHRPVKEQSLSDCNLVGTADEPTLKTCPRHVFLTLRGFELTVYILQRKCSLAYLVSLLNFDWRCWNIKLYRKTKRLTSFFRNLSTYLVCGGQKRSLFLGAQGFADFKQKPKIS